MGEFQPWHWVVILVIALVVFGPGKLGDLGSNVGKSIKEFRHAMKEPEHEDPARPARRADRPAGRGERDYDQELDLAGPADQMRGGLARPDP